ncbi:MAG: X-Pro dipeptidyl-peptidase [Gammaproteobacteria bacterium]|nr:X-Pro dipeptidyl-peptidase [Gammaproteobacteria bacterium]
MNTVIIDRNVMVDMRDGISLASDIYRPSVEGKYPVLVHRIPYNKSMMHYIGSQMLNPIIGVENDYVVIIQDCRGCFASEGVMTPYTQEADDGYDTIEWAAQQPWSNGRVGIYGSSYMGITCLQATLAAPPHLQAAMSYLTGSNLYDGWVYSGGALELGFNMGYTQGKAGQAIQRLDLDDENKSRLMEELKTSGSNRAQLSEYLPLNDAPILRERELLPYWHEYLEHNEYDDYWKRMDIVARIEEVKAPIMQIAAWYDQFLKGHLDLNTALKHHSNPTIRDNHRFIIGPWDHNSYEGHRLTWAGERNFGPKALSGVMAVSDLVIQWFDYWLKDKNSSLMESPRVRYFMMGDTNEWLQTTTWPPTSKEKILYLDSNGSANTRHGDGKLSHSAPGKLSQSDTYIYDPKYPVPTVGGRTFSLAAGGSGVQDQSEVEERADILVYTSEKLEKQIKIAGNILVKLWISSDGEDTDFTGKLVDVEPNGYCAVIADGIIRARYRNSFEKPEFLVPDQPTYLEVDLWDVAYTFKKGHRIRLEVSSSSFPRFSRNANSRIQPEFAKEEDLRPATQTIYHDNSHLSQLVLPEVE